jgi:hypothetical protein
MALNKNLLPQPADYYEGQGLTLRGAKNSAWKTTRCVFHGGSDSMRVSMQSGGFVCMACGVKGGDIISYQQQAHGLDFISAAKQLNAWVEDGKQHHDPNKPAPLPAREALDLLREEATLIALEGSRIGRGITPTASDLERIRKAAGRVNLIAEGIL